MPEHFRALLVIVGLALISFSFSRRFSAGIISSIDFSRRRNLWLSLTIIAFLSHSFWIYGAIALLALTLAQRREPNIPALFFSLLFALPLASIDIPGFGMVNYLFSANHLHLLTLAVLMPAFLRLHQSISVLPFGKVWPDKLLAGYLTLVIVLSLRDTTLTDTVRTAFYLCIEVFFPYYVISRGIREIPRLIEALLCFVIATLLLAFVGIFEVLRHWLLYNAVVDAMGLDWDYGVYLARSGSLRAIASTGHSIALGFAIAVSLGFYIFLQHNITNRLHRYLLMIVLCVGLLVPLSRGPWVGFATIAIIYIATGKNALKRLALLGLSGLLSILFLSFFSVGQKILQMVPFLGTIESGNLVYRKLLLESALVVIQRNPWFGSVDYLKAPEMQALIQGQGIIDIVNTYISVALSYGLVGLTLFIGFFLAVLLSIQKGRRAVQYSNPELSSLGRALLATQIGILVMIFTVSSITIIPIVYWSVAALGVAYSQIVREEIKFNYSWNEPHLHRN
jgi:O-antigen ligase